MGTVSAWSSPSRKKGADLDVPLRGACERVNHKGQHVLQRQVRGVRRVRRGRLVLEVDLPTCTGVPVGRPGRGVVADARGHEGKQGRVAGGRGEHHRGRFGRQARQRHAASRGRQCEGAHLIVQEGLHERLRRTGGATRLALI